MNKYIPAEKLIAEIERRKDEWQALINKNNAVNPTAVKEVICEDLNILDIIASLQQEQPESGSSEKPNNLLSEKQEQSEVDLEKFTEKVKTFQRRYKYPELVSIKGAMAFMARMFYQYPNVARQWYDSLPKATMDDARKEE